MSRLSDYVTYREYHGQTFILDTRQHLSFRIEAPVAKLLDLFREDTTAEAALERLAARYPAVPRQVLADDVAAAASFLADNRLLAGETYEGSPREAHTNTRYFQRYTIREKLLYAALLEVTYRCPERCVHCYLEPAALSERYAADRERELTTEEICGLLDQLAALNVMDVTFTGGEPFVRSDMFDILAHAHSKGLAIQIFSNGILLEDPNLQRLAGLRLLCFHSSLYSHIPEKHDQITGVKGSFDKTVHVLRTLSEQGVYVNFKFVLMEQNKEDFPGVIELARRIGASVQLISSVSPSARGACAITELGVRRDEDLMGAIKQWNEISTFSGGPFSLDDPICEAGQNSLSIDPYGTVTPCNAFRYEVGNVRRRSIAAIWNGSRRLKKWRAMTKRDLKDCQGCLYRARCCFCPGVAQKLSGDMLQKYGEACRQARLQCALEGRAVPAGYSLENTKETL